jgi:hypothetical protein
MAKVGKPDWEGTFGRMRGNDDDAPQTDLRSMILRMKYWQPVAVRTLVESATLIQLASVARGPFKVEATELR